MHVEWYGQSAFRLTRRGHDACSSTRSATCRRPPRRGIQFDYPPIDGVDGRPAARHPRALRPQRRRGDRRLARRAALDRGASRVADRRRSSPSPPSTTTPPGPNADRTRSSPSTSTACASATSATSARPTLRPEQAAALGARRPAVRPRRRRSDDRRRRRRRHRSAPERAVGRPDALPDATRELPGARGRVPRPDARGPAFRRAAVRHDLARRPRRAGRRRAGRAIVPAAP